MGQPFRNRDLQTVSLQSTFSCEPQALVFASATGGCIFWITSRACTCFPSVTASTGCLEGSALKAVPSLAFHNDQFNSALPLRLSNGILVPFSKLTFQVGSGGPYHFVILGIQHIHLLFAQFLHWRPWPCISLIRICPVQISSTLFFGL